MKQNHYFLLLISTVLSLVSLHGHGQSLVSVNQIGGTDQVRVLSSSADPQGNLYTAGYFTGTVDFDPGAQTNSLTSAGQEDGFVMKMDSAMNVLWVKRVGGAGNDRITSISAYLWNGNVDVFATGYFSQSADFDPGTAVNELVSAGGTDIFVLRLTGPNGLFGFARRIGGVEDDEATSLSIGQGTQSTKFYVYTTGFFRNTVDFNPGSGVAELTSAGGKDVFLSALNIINGAYELSYRFGSTGDDYGTSIYYNLHDQGYVFLGGNFKGTVDFDPSAGTNNLTEQTGGANGDVFFCRVHDILVEPTVVAHLPSSDDIELKTISMDPAEDAGTKQRMILVGNFKGSADLDPSGGKKIETSATQSGYIVYYSMFGILRSVRTFTGTGNVTISSASLGVREQIHVCGSFDGTMGLSTDLTSNTVTSAGGKDGFVSGVNGFGGYTIKGIQDADVVSVLPIQTPDGYPTQRLAIFGQFSGTANFGIRAPLSLTAAGTSNVFIGKIWGKSPSIYFVEVYPPGFTNVRVSANPIDGQFLSKGYCYSTTPFPTLATNPILVAGSMDEYKISGLTPNTTYYIRAFARTATDTVYSEVEQIKTLVAGSGVKYTYKVDITDYLNAGATVGAGGIRIAGNFADAGTNLPNWTPTHPGCAMTNEGNNIWSITIDYPDSVLTRPRTVEYKFVNNNWGTNEGASGLILCGVFAGGNYNRSHQFFQRVDGTVKCWNKCYSCSGDPVVITFPASNVTSTTARLSGNQTGNSNFPTSFLNTGICYSTSPNPTINDSFVWFENRYSQVDEGSEVQFLSPATTYYARAFAKPFGTPEQVFYGNQITFTTQGATQLAPSLTSSAINSIAANSAIAGGNITSDGGAAVTARGVCWSTSPNPTVALTTKTVDGSGTGSFTSNLAGLTPSTLYYVRAYATNSVGTSYGTEVQFTTLSVATVASLSTTSIVSITSVTAQSGGNITSDGGAAVTARGVCWSTSPNPTVALTTKTVDGSGTGSFTSNLAGLTPSTLYYVRAYATNSVGTSYGTEVQFTTLSVATVASLSTTSIGSITSVTAQSGGNITSDGGAAVTARGVCWSTSPNPTVALTTKTVDGSGTGSFTSNLSGLTPSTLYYVRAYATNSVGTSYGTEVQFTTLVVGLEEAIESGEIKAWPIPFTDKLMLQFKGERPARFELLNGMGARVMAGTLFAGQNVLEPGTIPAGIYYLKVTSSRRVFRLMK